MNPVLEKLINLQHLADQVMIHRRRCEEIPVVISKLDKQLLGAQSKVETIRQKLKDFDARIRKSERAIADSRDTQGKYRTQLFKLKSNREYQALNKEIEMLADKISEYETEIIECMEGTDTANADLKESETFLDQEKKRILREKKDAENDLNGEKKHLEEKEKTFQTLREEIEESIRLEYERLVRKLGRGVAELNGRNCNACHVNVRPQIAANALGNHSLIRCDKCGVFLYTQPKESDQPVTDA